jgi:hypothetical protein
VLLLVRGEQSPLGVAGRVFALQALLDELGVRLARVGGGEQLDIRFDAVVGGTWQALIN